MQNLILVALLACNPPIIENRTEFPWNDYDQQHLDTAKKRCGEIYKNSPCVVKFIKRTESDYSVICGKGKE